jgi:hypothetical protein
MEKLFSTLVVVESGAASLGLGAHARVITQGDDERPAAFAIRVRSELEGDALQRVILLAGPAHDPSRIAARAQVAQAASAFLATTGGGSLVLAASDPRGELAQRALGEILRDQLGATVSVAVRDIDAVAIPTAA